METEEVQQYNAPWDKKGEGVAGEGTKPVDVLWGFILD